jgi:soluble cytochrome b562
MASKAALLKDTLHALEVRTKRATNINKEFEAAKKASERATARIESATEAKTKNDTELTEFREIVIALGGEVPEPVSETTDETTASGEVSETTDIAPNEGAEGPAVTEGETTENEESETPRAKGGRFARKN